MADLNRVARNYKTLKEDFVSNLTGGSISEINWVTAVASSAGLLWACLQKQESVFVRNGFATLVVDFLLNVGTVLAAITVYSSQSILLNALLLAPALFIHSLPRPRPRSTQLKPPIGKRQELQREIAPASNGMSPFPVRPFLTSYRGGMMIVTCVAILAVDFHVFPRRFAKVENWGTSLMDLGVGSFVFSGGVVSAKAAIKDEISAKPASLRQRFVGSLRHSMPLLIMGFIRLYSVKNLQYAEHVTEYGVHWNFFFTLGFLPPFVALFQSFIALVPRRQPFSCLRSYTVLSLLIALIYQIVLESTPLQAFVLTAPRVDIISQNREGIASFIGYLSIFLAGRGVGMYVIPRFHRAKSDFSLRSTRHRLLLYLVGFSSVYAVLFYLVTSYRFGATPVSRRLANLPYVLWVAAFNSAQIFVSCLIESVMFPAVHLATDSVVEKQEIHKAVSKILRVYNRNGLVIFLVANLLTGLVNMSVKTLDATDLGALGILVGYATILSAFALGLDFYNLTVKI